MKDPRTEAEVSRDIVKFLREVGFAVWSVEQGYRKEKGGTRQTPGIPDLIVMGHGHFTFAEVKRDGGKLRPAQIVFRDECAEHGVPWQIWDCTQDAFDWLVEVGFIPAGDRQ